MVRFGPISCTLVQANGLDFLEESLSNDSQSTYVCIEPGTQYSIRLFNYSTTRRVVAVWVDGEKVFSNTYWLEPGSNLAIKGWPRTAQWPDVLTDVVPFRTEALPAATPGGSAGAAAAAAPGAAAAPVNHGEVKVMVYEVVQLDRPTTQTCTVGSLRKTALTAGGGDTKAALTQNQATHRPDIKPRALEEVAAWGIGDSHPVMFLFKYRDTLAMDLERKKQAGTPGASGTVHPNKAGASARGGGAVGGGKRMAPARSYEVGDDGILELKDSDTEDEEGEGGQAAPPADAVKAEHQPKRQRRETEALPMLDLTGGGDGVVETSVVKVRLYWEPTPGSLRELPAAYVPTPADTADDQAQAMTSLRRQAKDNLANAVMGTSQAAAAGKVLRLMAEDRTTELGAWPAVAAEAKRGQGVILVPV